MTTSPDPVPAVQPATDTSDDASPATDTPMDTTESATTKPFTFGFAKKTAAPLVASVAAVADDVDIELVENDEITIIDDGDLIAKDGSRKRRGPLVIPMMKTNDWRMSASSKKTKAAIIASVTTDDDGAVVKEEETDKPSLTDLTLVDPTDMVAVAKAQLLRAAADAENPDDADEIKDIPLLLQNKVPEGYETDDKLDVSLRPVMSTVEDYDSVPINQFGTAMLRGMGWSEGAPIGRSNKVVHLPKIPELRPKGMGLGANKSLVEKLKGKEKKGGKTDDAEEKLVVKVGGFARLTSGEYCKIDSVDTDMNRCVVRLAIGGGSRSVSQLKMQLVGKDEYDKEGKCLNKTKYDLAKAAQQEVIDVDSGSADDRDRRSSKKSSKKRRSPPAPKRRRPWLHVDIVVRIVDERSRHYKEKMVVLDVVDGGHAAQLRTMDNKVLDRDMPAHYLETVVPRQVDALVKVLNSGGLLARLIEQDRKKQKAIIEMVDNDETRQVHFDDISQYVEHD